MICINFGIILWKFDQIMRLCGLNFAADPYISSFSFTVLWKKKKLTKKKQQKKKKKKKNQKKHTHKKNNNKKQQQQQKKKKKKKKKKTFFFIKLAKSFFEFCFCGNI